MFENVYQNRKVLITGATGFKGSWLSLLLLTLGADVLGYGLVPDTIPSVFNELKLNEKIKTIYGNILDRDKLQKTFNDFAPEFVFHLAAQPLVRRSYSEPVLTYETNVIGTLNVLMAAKNCNTVKAFVNVTTDKCYENKECIVPYKEDDPMGGYDMYSSSKGCVEIMSSSFRRSFLNTKESFSMATARSGNVIGGGDWAQDRLVPDCIKAINNNSSIEIRNPSAVRPWQYVLEPLSGYLLLGQKLFVHGENYAQGFNFGPQQDSVLTVADVAKRIVELYGKGEVIVGEKSSLHEAELLMLDIDKARKILGWSPCFSSDKAIESTVEWYRRFYDKKNMYDFTMNQIEEYNSVFEGKYQCTNLKNPN